MARVLKNWVSIGLILCAVVVVAVVTWIGIHRYARHTAASALDQFVAHVPWIHAMTFGGMDVEPFGEGLLLNHVILTVTGADQPVQIDRVVVHSMDRNHPWPRRMHVEFHGIQFKTSQISGNDSLLRRLGYDSLQSQLECAYRYEAESKTLILERLHVDVADAGSATLSGRVGNLDLVDLVSGRVGEAGIAGRLGGMLIEQGRLHYVDASLLDRSLSSLARSRGLSPHAYRRHLARKISVFLTTDPQTDVGRIGAALSSFLKRPTQLVTSVAPDRPIALFWLLWFRDLEKLVDQLGLQVSTIPPHDAR